MLQRKQFVKKTRGGRVQKVGILSGEVVTKHSSYFSGINRDTLEQVAGSAAFKAWDCRLIDRSGGDAM